MPLSACHDHVITCHDHVNTRSREITCFVDGTRQSILCTVTASNANDGRPGTLCTAMASECR
eukprot:249461-Rhodomonas_salina.1